MRARLRQGNEHAKAFLSNAQIVWEDRDTPLAAWRLISTLHRWLPREVPNESRRAESSTNLLTEIPPRRYRRPVNVNYRCVNVHVP